MGYIIQRTNVGYASVQEAVNAALPAGDVIIAEPARYPTDTLATSKSFKLTVDGGEAIYSSITQGKSTFVLSGPGPVELENLVGDAITNPSGNGGLVRSDITGTLTLRRCRGLPRCQTWILTGTTATEAIVNLIDCWVYQAGAGDGLSHATYIANGAEFNVIGGYYADTDGWNTGSAGHLLKWLTKRATIRNVRLIEGRSSRALSCEWGGDVLIDGSTVIEQDLLLTDNSDIFGFGGQLPAIGGVRSVKAGYGNSIEIGRYVEVSGQAVPGITGFIHNYITPAPTITDHRGTPEPSVIDWVTGNFSAGGSIPTVPPANWVINGTLSWGIEAPPAPPAPLEAVLSEWGAWADVGALPECIDNERTIPQERSRVILTYPAFGGTPEEELDLDDERDVVQACTPVDPEDPDWMPEVGRIKAVSAALMTSVDTCPARNCAYSGVEGIHGTFAWCGSCFVPTLGTYGSIVHTGGGHDAHHGNAVYRYDLETGLWTILKMPWVPLHFNAQGRPTADTTYGEFRDESGTPLPTEPFIPHTYDSVCFIPGADGGNVKGYMFLGMNQNSSTPTYSPQRHWFNFDTNLWERIGNPWPATSYVHTPALYDSTRKRMVMASTSPDRVPYGLPIGPGATREWVRLTPTGQFTFIFENFDVNIDHMVSADLYIRTLSGNSVGGWNPVLYRPDTFEKKIPTVIGSDLPPPAASGKWVESRGGVYFYNGLGGAAGDTTVYKLSPTGDPWNDPWQSEKEVLLAEENIPQRGSSNRHYSRFRHVPALDIWVWLARASGKVFAFNPSI